MQFTTVRNKKKDYDEHLKLEKLVHSNQEEKMFPSYFEVEKIVPIQLFQA